MSTSSLVAYPHSYIHILPITSADNNRSISPHFTTSKIRTSAFYRSRACGALRSLVYIRYQQ